MSKKVSYAQLHAGFFVPGYGNFKETLPPDNKTLKNFAMTLTTGDAILLSWNNVQTNAPVEYLVGAANIKGAMLIPTLEAAHSTESDRINAA